jgi:hypothetical protein
MVAARAIKKKFRMAAARKMKNFATELPYISMNYVYQYELCNVRQRTRMAVRTSTTLYYRCHRKRMFNEHIHTVL